MLKRYCKGEIIISLVVILGCMYLYYETRKFEGLAIYGRMGPEYWPRILLIVIMALSVFIALINAMQVKRGEAAPGFQAKYDKHTVRLFAAMGLIVFYLIGMRYFGFLTLTPFVMVAFMTLLGEKSKGWMVSIALVLPFLIVILFTKVMYVPLPRGTGIFLRISQLIY